MEYLSEHRKKLIDKNLNEQLQKHTELLVINSELIQQNGSSSKKNTINRVTKKN
jgi:hypothetical protein